MQYCMCHGCCRIPLKLHALVPLPFQKTHEQSRTAAQIINATTVHVRRPGNPKKWRARVLCEGIICDLALLTVDEAGFWSDDLMSLQFVAVPELQARPALLPCWRTCACPAIDIVQTPPVASLPDQRWGCSMLWSAEYQGMGSLLSL
jgi:hypothetical protein